MTPPLEDKALAAFLLGVPAAMAGTTDDGVPDAKFLAYGQTFSPYTAKFRGHDEAGKLSEATATLIGPHWAITAAHVAHENKNILLLSGEVGRIVDRVVIHPDWSEEKHGFHDLALLHCEQPLAISYYPPLSDGSEKEGQTVSIVGFGLTGKLSEGHGTYDGKLRAGTQKIERFERTVIVCHASCGSSPLEFCISPGDSGGPLFAGGKLAGVNSFTMAARGPLKSKSGEETAHTRVSLYREWIDSVVGGEK